MPTKAHAASSSVTITPTVTGDTPISAPATTSSPVVQSTPPPVVDVPAVPAGVALVKLADYRGYHPRTTQLNAAPSAATEIKASTAYASTFGPAMPPPDSFATQLTNSDGWTQLRVQLEDFLGYVKSEEAIAWKGTLIAIDQARAVYLVTVANNPAVSSQFPFLTRLLDAGSLVSKKSAVTRKHNAKEKAAKAAATGLGAVATTSSTPAATNGGAAH